VPVLAVFALVPDSSDCLVELVEESKLSPHAKVGDSKEAKFLKDELSGKLDLNGCGGHEVLKGKRGYLHNVADVQAVDPFVLVQVAKDVLHVWVANVDSHTTAEPRVGFLLRKPYLIGA
jgi:hypothetical protein